ncbi:MAG: 50S ribosomal protein L11 methyltransferase, partial [Acutalibacter sp.]|nr:50S ribosomal protein L11 methyltransferase [Acutalibacter sp.]
EMSRGLGDVYKRQPANIVADVVIELTRDVPRFLAPGGVYIISGIIDAREADVLAALAGRYTVIERREDRGWVAMALRAC